MGKISYRPKKNQEKHENKRKGNTQKPRDLLQEKEALLNYSMNSEEMEEVHNKNKVIAINSNKKNYEKLDNLKVVGELECAYHVFIEDYVYTYIYQLAKADLSKESAAILIGEIYGDSKEAVVRGIIPVKMDELSEDSEWIDINIIEDIEEQRKQYFKDQDIIGWMHMQPGYGTMLTMKELREHKAVFEGSGSICLLVDAINKIEAVFVYEDDELKEQTGYCMYYERNEAMQQYMLDHPFSSSVKEQMKDAVVNQFREIGKIRKAEYTQRKSLNFTVMLASIILIALTAVIVKMNEGKSMVNSSVVSSQTAMNNEDINLAITPATTEGETELAEPTVGIKDEQVKEERSTQITDTLANADATVEDENYEIYVVQPGDTLADISYKKYGEAKKSIDIAKFNDITNTNQIYVGQEIKLPKYNK